MPGFSGLPVMDTDATAFPGSPGPLPQGFLPISKKRAIGNNTFQVDPTTACLLPTAPIGAVSAIIVAEAANSTITGKLMRFWMDGSIPDTYHGIPMYDGCAYEISGVDDLKNFRVFSITGDSHVLQIQYFSAI